MTQAVLSSTSSAWKEACKGATLAAMLSEAPYPCTIVVPSSSHRELVLRTWVEVRGGADLPEVVTMPMFARTIARECGVNERVMDDAEANLLLDLALEDADEKFRPSGLSVAKIVRWKQEGVHVDRLIDDAADPDAPTLYDLERTMKVWKAYEIRKGKEHADRGDLSHHIVDAITVLDELPGQLQRPTLVVATHGLAYVDRMMLHMLSMKGADVAIQFAAHIDINNRSADEAIWLVGHGWEEAESGVRKAESGERKAERGVFDSAREEVRSAIAFLKDKVTEGASPSDVALVIPSDGSYDNVLMDVAATCGLPIAMEDDQPLSSQDAVTAVYAACQVVLNNWEREDVVRLALSPSVATESPLTPLVAAADQFRIMGGDGLPGWSTRLGRSTWFVNTSHGGG